MVRSEFVRRLVLNAICDDFENVDQVILRQVAEYGAKCGLTVDRAEVVEALAGLVRDGLARAYLLSGAIRDPFSGELEDMPSLETIEENFETYFYVTKAGMDLHRSDATWWPFDGDDNLRPGCRFDFMQS